MPRLVLPNEMQLVDWREPMVARSEDVLIEGGPDGPGPSLSTRWHMDSRSYQRVMDMMACYHCLTAFPARPCAGNIGLWDTSGFNHVRPKAVAHRLIREEKCPVCAAPISADALGHHDEGENPLNKRPAEQIGVVE